MFISEFEKTASKLPAAAAKKPGFFSKLLKSYVNSVNGNPNSMVLPNGMVLTGHPPKKRG